MKNKNKSTAQLWPEADPEQLLRIAAAEQDPVLKKALLDRAVEAQPDSLEAHRQLLMLGQLWQRDGKHVNYDLIKCYLLHAFDPYEPEPSAKRTAMIRELTNGAELQKCLGLTDDPEAFVQQYCETLCSEYLRYFLLGSNARMRRVFGFSFGSAEKNLAAPVADMLFSMQQAELPPLFRKALPAAMRSAWRTQIGDEAPVEAELLRLEQNNLKAKDMQS